MAEPSDSSSSSSSSSSSTACGVNRASRANKTLYSLPVHCLTEADLRAENGKGIMQHFHAPANSHNRFLASLTQQERAILRDFDRPPPYNSAVLEGTGWMGERPATAPCPRRTGNTTAGVHRPRARQHCLGMAVAGPCPQQAGSHSAACGTGKPLPCGSPSTVMDVDLLTGKPATAHICSTQRWRVAKVKAFAVPHSTYGYDEGGKRAPHHSYSFYKYYGFAGQGAKTSWASPKSKAAATPARGRS